MANFVILRVAKLKTGQLSASGRHNFREQETPNADKERTVLNEHVGAESTDALMKAVSARIPAAQIVTRANGAQVKTKRRKDAVVCLEYLITASPEYFGEDWREKEKTPGREYFDDAIKWLSEKHGKENIVCATMHLDESTPHLAVYVVPITRDGRLCAKDIIGGNKKTLSKMQTEFADSVGKRHGLERGIEKSGAVHHPNAAIVPMAAERLTLRKQVKELKAEVERLTKRADAGDSELAKMEERMLRQRDRGLQNLKTSRERKEALQVAISELAAAKQAGLFSAAELAEAQAKLTQQGAELARMQKALASKDATINGLKVELADLRTAQEAARRLPEAAQQPPQAFPLPDAPRRSERAAEALAGTAKAPAAPGVEEKSERAPEGVGLATPPGLYSGLVLSVERGWLVQDAAKKGQVAHRIADLNLETPPEPGEKLQITLHPFKPPVVVRAGKVAAPTHLGRE